MTNQTKPPIRVAITGGPGVGKSTVLEILAQQNYQTVPEAARIVIQTAQKEGTDCLPWMNLQKFQNRLSQTQLDIENSAQGEIIFSDRGIIDGHAYSLIDKIEVPELIYQFGRNRYQYVFILDPLSSYRQDACRKEDPEKAKLIHNRIFDSYKSFGYNPISVPAISAKERVDFILNKTRGKE